MSLRLAVRRSVLLAAAVTAAAVALAAPASALADTPSGLPAPVAGGTSAANIDLRTAGRRVLVRWVARATGTLAALHLRIQADGSACRQSGRTGYGLGNGGSWLVTTHPVLPDGRPDERTTLSSFEFRPCSATAPLVDVVQGVTRIPLRLAVTAGSEYATVVRNTDPSPTANYTSVNFLYASGGLLGANGRNERSPLAPDAYYGLDPRELVGFSVDSGRTWSLPGGPYGAPGGRNFIPTYLQEYANGQITGQPYYRTNGPSTADRTMLFQNIRHPWTIRELGAFTPIQGSGSLSLSIDGRTVAQRAVSGIGMLRAAIDPVTVAPGQIVRVTSTGLSIWNMTADTAWGRLVGLQLPSTLFKIEGERNFSAAAPVYALPAYDALGGVSFPPLSGLHSSGHPRTGPLHKHRRRHRRAQHKHRRRHAKHHLPPASFGG